MEKTRKVIDALKIMNVLIDIIIIAVLVFTVLVTVSSPTMRFLLAVVGCGAIFNNCKHLLNLRKERKNRTY